jgi:phage terminase large subunit-like protein
MKGTLNYKANAGQKKLNKVLRKDNITRVLAISGARSGKTFEFVRTIVSRAIHGPGSRHAIIRKHFAEAKKYIWLDTLPKVLKICYPQLIPVLKKNSTDFYYTFPNGSEIWIGGLDNKERADKILGGEYNTIYFNEVSEISYSSVVVALTRLAMMVIKDNGNQMVNKAFFDENPQIKTHWSNQLFNELIDPITRIALNNPNKYATIHLRPEDNQDNLPDGYIDDLKNLTGASRQRFYEGVFQNEMTGALWSQETINKYRVSEYPELIRIVIPIDPAITKTEVSNETGIIPLGLGTDGHIYILDDISGTYSPNEWAATAISAYDKWQADAIVGEVNQGGDMIETIIYNIRGDVGYIPVRATRGKYIRAEPISLLYDRGIVHHVGQFVDLEYQMVTFTGDREDDSSPDRMDALVWGIFALISQEEIQGSYTYSDPVNISPI